MRPFNTIILCPEKTAATVRYSVFGDKENLFTSSYMTYLPTEDELEQVLKQERDEAESERLYRSLALVRYGRTVA